MNVKKLPFVFFGLLFIAHTTYAQSYFLDGETVKVFDDLTTKITFPGEVQTDTLGNNKDYLLSIKSTGGKSTLSITVGADNPAQSCTLYVVEGDAKAMRYHRLRIYHAKEYDNPNEAIYDFSDLQKMESEQKRFNLEMQSKNKSQTTDGAAVNDGSHGDSILFDTRWVSREELHKKAKFKMDRLEHYMEGLCTKNIPAEEGIKSAMKLFGNDEKVSVVINRKGVITHNTITEYLIRLSKVEDVKHVNITFGKLNFISNFVKNEDGSWEGVCSFQEEFKAVCDDGKPCFTSNYTGRITIKVKITNVFDNGEMRPDVEVFLGNLSLDQN